MAKKLSSTKPAERLLTLYTTLLMSSRPLSLTELANEFECSKPSVLRDIEKLEGARFGKVLKSIKGREALFSLQKPEKIPALSLNAEGIHQLALCRNFLFAILPKAIQKEISASLNQTASYLPSGHQSLPDGIGVSLNKGYIDYTPFQDTLKKLQQAIIHKRVCAVRYKGALVSEEKEYDFAPKRLIAYRESIFIEGYVCVDKGDAVPKYDNTVRLALHRIKDCIPTRRTSEKVPNIPSSDNEALGVMLGEPFTATIRFAPAAATYVAERQWSDGQKIEQHEDGSITLQLNVHNAQECIAWVLSFADTAEVIEPDWLRRDIMEKIQKLRKIYVLK